MADGPQQASGSDPTWLDRIPIGRLILIVSGLILALFLIALVVSARLLGLGLVGTIIFLVVVVIGFICPTLAHYQLEPAIADPDLRKFAEGLLYGGTLWILLALVAADVRYSKSSDVTPIFDWFRHHAFDPFAAAGIVGAMTFFINNPDEHRREVGLVLALVVVGTVTSFSTGGSWGEILVAAVLSAVLGAFWASTGPEERRSQRQSAARAAARAAAIEQRYYRRKAFRAAAQAAATGGLEESREGETDGPGRSGGGGSGDEPGRLPDR